MIKPNHLNYSAPPLQIKTSGHHLHPSLNEPHELEEGINYIIMPALRLRIGALKSVVVLVLPRLTPQHALPLNCHHTHQLLQGPNRSLH